MWRGSWARRRPKLMRRKRQARQPLPKRPLRGASARLFASAAACCLGAALLSMHCVPLLPQASPRSKSACARRAAAPRGRCATCASAKTQPSTCSTWTPTRVRCERRTALRVQGAARWLRAPVLAAWTRMLPRSPFPPPQPTTTPSRGRCARTRTRTRTPARRPFSATTLCGRAARWAASRTSTCSPSPRTSAARMSTCRWAALPLPLREAAWC